jgi:exodeoxyribonuclease VII large subunit
MPPEKGALEAASPAILTVSELAEAIQGVLSAGLERVWVVGEISNFRAHRTSGHCYFTLKDEAARLPAVLWRTAAARLRFRPEDGLEVIAFGEVRFYGPQGRLQLYVERLEPRGLGALRAQLERLRERLEREGLLDPARKRPLPYLPRCIGIVTALDGAALRDLLRMLRDRFAERRIVVRPVRVQGFGAELEIAQGLRDLQGIADLDVVIVGRGGGSAEDLWAFNDEGVARAIVACRVPVVSAVGHEIDVTISDLVADCRAPTPTAAAELVLPRRRDVERELERRLRSIHGAAIARIGRARRELAALEVRLLHASPRRVLAVRRALLGHAADRLQAAFRRKADGLRAAVAAMAASLSGLSPLAVLARGYSVVRKAGSRSVVRSAEEVEVGEGLDVWLHRGRLRATVDRVEPAPQGERDR